MDFPTSLALRLCTASLLHHLGPFAAFPRPSHNVCGSFLASSRARVSPATPIYRPATARMSSAPLPPPRRTTPSTSASPSAAPPDGEKQGWKARMKAKSSTWGMKAFDEVRSFPLPLSPARLLGLTLVFVCGRPSSSATRSALTQTTGPRKSAASVGGQRLTTLPKKSSSAREFCALSLSMESSKKPSRRRD